ncbi:hypothetical protein Tco_1494237 [Tanacetum coccineum]
MVNLEFCDTHNIVAYLKKPEGSEGFYQIVDFLNASHIRYALTKNPTTYVSPIKQFCQTAIARTLNNGEIKLTATIDGTVKTVTETSVRRHLQLADAAGISSLPTTEIFEQLSLMGAPSTSQPPLSPTSRRTTRHESVVPQLRSPTQTLIADETIHQERGDSVEMAATTATSLDAEHDSGGSPKCQDTILGDKPAQTRFERLSKQSNDSPLLRVNTLGSDEGSMILQELMVFCTTLSKKVESLETDLKETKQIYGAAYTRLIKKVKKLEKTVKSSQARRRERTVVFDDEDALEDPSKQGRTIVEIDQDPSISLVQHDAEIQGSTVELVSTAGAAVTTTSVVVSTASPTRNTGVSTVDDITMAKTLVYIRKNAAKDKGKGKMAEFEIIQTKTKLQQEQERLNFDAAVRLQAELEEKRSKIAMGQRLQAEEREKYTEAEQARMLTELINQRKRYFSNTLQQLRGYSFDEIKTLFKTTMRKVNTFVPIESEVDRAVLELAARSSKRAIEEELDQESSKRQKIDESLELAEEPRDKEADKLSQEEPQQMI